MLPLSKYRKDKTVSHYNHDFAVERELSRRKNKINKVVLIDYILSFEKLSDKHNSFNGGVDNTCVRMLIRQK